MTVQSFSTDLAPGAGAKKYLSDVQLSHQRQM
jgi:hypothetical protein